MSRFSLDRLKDLRSGKYIDVPTSDNQSTAQQDVISGSPSTESPQQKFTSLQTYDQEGEGYNVHTEDIKACLSQSYSGPDRPTTLSQEGQLSSSYGDQPAFTDQLTCSYGDHPTITETLEDFELPKDHPSPMRERIMGAFARLAPETNTSGQDTTVKLQETSRQEGSWLLQVRGRFSRSGAGDTSTKDDNSSQSNSPRDNIPHSVSDVNISKQEERQAGKKRPQSQIFDFEPSDWSHGGLENLPNESEGNQSNCGTSDNEAVLVISDCTSSTPADTPSKLRKRFGISSFLDRSNSNSGSPSKGGAAAKVVTPAETPRRSLRNFVFKSFKSTPTESMSSAEGRVADYMMEGSYPPPAAVDTDQGPDLAPLPEPQAYPIPDKEKLNLDLKDTEHDIDEDAVEAEEEHQYSWNSDYDINQYGVMKGEANAEDGKTPSTTCKVHKVPVLLNPVTVLLLVVINFPGFLPFWLSGFLTGIILCAILCLTILLKLNPAVSYISAKDENSKPAQIQVFEEPPLTQAWMNLLPQKFHPYDCETYQVKNTISVRVTVEHHILKIEYPEKNISMRQCADEVIPVDLKFHLHTDHIDLSTASIRLLPDKLANSKKFKKKYPIEIRPNGLVKTGFNVVLPTYKCSEFEKDEELSEFESVDGSPLSNSPAHSSILDHQAQPSQTPTKLADRQDSTRSLLPDQDKHDNKSYYIFARSDREKEDIYRALLDGHYFLQDSFRDADRMQGIYAPNQSSRMTARERNQYFSDFMSKVMEAPTAVYPNTPGTPAFTGPPPELQYPEWCAHFLNVYIYRIFYDVHQNKFLTDMIMKKVNNKLAKVKELKYFKYIGITNLGFGRTTPQIKWVSRPSQNVRGVWTHVGLDYEGCITVSIEINGINLLEDAPGGGVQFKMLMEEDPGALPVQPQGAATTRDWSRLEAATNSDEEDSDESDSEEQDIQGLDAQQGQSSRKWWEIVQENELVKSGLSRLSSTCWWKSKVENMNFTLKLEIRKFKGVLVLNIPTPPTDRLWFAFKTAPDLDIRMLSYFGEDLLGDDSSLKSTIINKVFQLVNTKIQEELVKVVVLPNMIDIPIKLMDGLPFSNVPEINKDDVRNKLVLPQ